MTRSQIDEIKQKINIVDLINQNVKLTKVGNDYRGATSATSKSGKSLIVNEQNQLYNNTATNDGGDVFNWIAYANNLNVDTDFKDILKIAAEEAGVELQTNDSHTYSEKKEVYPFLKSVAQHYHMLLTDEHREYVKKQWNISDETIDKLLIGWCYDKNSIERALYGEYERATIAKSGMVYVNDDRFTDVFKGRIMFPYWKNNEVVYFIGRDPDHNKDSKTPKYKKQPVHSEKYPYVSEVIDNNTFFGEDSIRGKDDCFIVEGITDCIRCLENDIPCISPVTVRIKESEKEHAYQLVKNMRDVYICNDNEDNNSGINGALETSEYLESKGVHTKIIQIPMPDGMTKIDVADYLKTHTREEFEELKKTSANSIWEMKLQMLNVPENTIDKTRTVMEFINCDLEKMEDSIKIPFLKNDVRLYFDMGVTEMNDIIKNAKKQGNKAKYDSVYFDDKGKFLVKDMANYITARNHYITMEDTQDIYYYKNGKYITMGERIIAKTVQSALGNASSKHVIDETINYIQNDTVVDRKAITNDCGKINLLNGVYDIATDTLEPHDPDVIFITQLPVKYNPDAKCPTIEKFMVDVMQPEDIEPMYEFIGYCMIPDTRLQRSVMLVGHGANGKSVLLGMIGQFMGSDNVSGESLHQLENDPYSIAELYGKLVNIFPDLAEQNIYKNEAFKMLTGNEENGMRARRIYGQPFKFKNTARLIFSANKPPSVTTDDNYAYFRRWMIFEFLNKFAGDDADKNLIYKLTTEEEMSGLFNLVIGKLKHLLTKEDYSYSRENVETERLYRIKSDPISVFSTECVVFSEDDCRKHVMYEAYVKWCENNSIKPKTENVFSRRFSKMYESGRESQAGADGKRQKVWNSCTIRHGSVTVLFGMGDEQKTDAVDIKNDENIDTSLLNSTCYLINKKINSDKIISPYGTTYRENGDGLVKKELKNDSSCHEKDTSLMGDGNSDRNGDGLKKINNVMYNQKNITIVRDHTIEPIPQTELIKKLYKVGMSNPDAIVQKLRESGELVKHNEMIKWNK